MGCKACGAFLLERDCPSGTLWACGGELLLGPVEEKLLGAESCQFCHFPPQKFPLPCPPCWCALRLRGQVGRGPAARGGRAAIRFRGEEVPEGQESCRRSPWLQEFLCCGLPGAGRALKGVTQHFSWLFCAFVLNVCSRPLLTAAYQAGCPLDW